MAIVKAHFTRSQGEIQDILRYIIHRPGRAGERVPRLLFDFAGDRSIEEAYRLIAAQKGMTYFHVILNFHPTREDTRQDLNLPEITRQTFATLEERLSRRIRFLAVEHHHTDKRHIHAVAMVKLARGERIGIADWQACREAATDQALFQRRALAAVRPYQHGLQQERHFSPGTPSRLRLIALAGARAHQARGPRLRTLHIPQPCPKCDGIIKQPLKTLKSGTTWCPVHGVIREGRKRMTQEKEQGLGL
jgi:hypothetical protein